MRWCRFVSKDGPRFGLVEVDRATQRRTVKPSGRWLGGVARTGLLDD